MSALRRCLITESLARSIAGEAPVLYAITDNGRVTTDTHHTLGEASTRLDTLNQRYPNHGHSIVPLYLHPAPKEPTA